MISMTVPVVWRAKQKQLFFLVNLLQRIDIAKPPATPLSSMRDHLPPPTVLKWLADLVKCNM
jgi:hypothetical protein